MTHSHSAADATYDRWLPDLQAWVGWFVLVRDEQVGGVFPTYQAAAHAWMSLYGPVPALIRRVERLPSAAAAVAAPAEPAVKPSPDETVIAGRVAVWGNFAFFDGSSLGTKEYVA